MPMTEVCLLVNPDPPIRSYLHHAYPLSILSSCDEYLPWFRSNFIQLFSEAPDHLDFLTPMMTHLDNPQTYFSPLLSVTRLNRQIINFIDLSSRDSTLRFVLDCLTDGYYVDLEVDEYYLPDRSAFKRYHESHSLLIFGYNSDEEKFRTIGYDQNNNYKRQNINFSMVLQAYGILENKNHMSLVSYLPQPTVTRTRIVEYKFNVELVSEMLKDYIYSNNTLDSLRLILRFDYNSESRAFGINAIGRLEFEPNEGSDFIDPRSTYCLWEHKKCMVDRIRFLETAGYLDQSASFAFKYAEIEGLAKTLSLLAIKFNLQNRGSILQRMRKLKKELIEREGILATKILESLD